MQTPQADPIAERIKPIATAQLIEMLSQLDKPDLDDAEIAVTMRIGWELDGRLNWEGMTDAEVAEAIDAMPVDTAGLVEYFTKRLL